MLEWILVIVLGFLMKALEIRNNPWGIHEKGTLCALDMGVLMPFQS
jgi:hypothetical protein